MTSFGYNTLGFGSYTSRGKRTVSYLVIAGGGGGGGDFRGGGAGAGGYRNSFASEDSGGGASTETPFIASTSVSYTITVGGRWRCYC